MTRSARCIPFSLATAATLAMGGAAAGPPLLEDSERNIHIPPEDELQQTLQVGAVHDGETIQVRYRFETEDPSWYHQYWVFEGGEWVRRGSGGPEPDPDGFYEDRISMMLDAEGVGLAEYSGFMAVHDGMRTLTGELQAEAVEAHPHLGERLGRSDLRKYIHQSREGDRAEAAWDAVKDPEDLDALREEGTFLDLWQWRAHRSHPVGYADNGYVLEYRHGSSGRSMFRNNEPDDGDGPAYMFDPERTERRALDVSRLRAQGYGQDDRYYLHEDEAVEFDPAADWQEGDAIPFRILQEPDGSRGAIRASGGYTDGAWEVRIERTLEAPDPTDSHALTPGETHAVAFAVHSGVGARWHRISLPRTLGLETSSGESPDGSDLVARYTDGDLDEASVDKAGIPLIYPGQMTWQWLNRPDHPGAGMVRDGGHSVREMHDPDSLQEKILRHEKAIKAE